VANGWPSWHASTGVDRPHELPDAPPGEPATISFEGRALSAKAGEPLAVALLAHGIDIASRSVKYHRPRGAFCLAGTCAQCWMRIDGIPNRAACTTPVTSGMIVSRENAFPSAELDLFRAADLMFPGGLDHHKLGTTPSRAVNMIIGGATRQMAGLGAIADDAQIAPSPSMRHLVCDLLVIGGGPAGLAAAETAAKAGLGVLLVEKRRELGGQLLGGLFDDDAELSSLRARARGVIESHGGQVWPHAVALGIYPGEGREREVLVRRYFGLAEEHLVTVKPDAVILATGGYEQAALFGDNDLPGHYGARALARLLVRRVLPGNRVVIVEGVTPVETASRLAKKLVSVGATVTRVSAYPHADPAVLSGRVPREARGRARVKGLEIGSATDPTAKAQVLRCSLIASALPQAPAFELAVQAGASVEHRPDLGGFAVKADPGSGRASAHGVFAAGDVTGATTARRAMHDGVSAGLSAALFFGPDAALEEARERAFHAALGGPVR